MIIYAGFWRRLAAYTLDVVPITLATTGVFYFFLGFDQTWNAYWSSPGVETRAAFLDERNQIRDLSFVIWLVYSTVFEASPLQGTLGKRVLGIKVVDDEGERISVLRSVLRNVFKLSAYLSLSIGFIWAAFSRHKQAWHDYLARTYVELDDGT